MYEGYLYTSTVDFLATSETDMIYTWTLLVIGYILPNILILLSHLAIILIYRQNNFEAWLERQGSREPRNNYVTKHRLEVGIESYISARYYTTHITTQLSYIKCLLYLVESTHRELTYLTLNTH